MVIITRFWHFPFINIILVKFAFSQESFSRDLGLRIRLLSSKRKSSCDSESYVSCAWLAIQLKSQPKKHSAYIIHDKINTDISLEFIYSCFKSDIPGYSSTNLVFRSSGNICIFQGVWWNKQIVSHVAMFSLNRNQLWYMFFLTIEIYVSFF